MINNDQLRVLIVKINESTIGLDPIVFIFTVIGLIIPD